MFSCCSAYIPAPLFAFYCFHLVWLFLYILGIKTLMCFKNTVFQVLLVLSEAVYIS